MKAKKLIVRVLTLAMVMCMLFALAIPASAATVEAAKGLDEVKYGVFKFNQLYQGEAQSRGTAFLINEDTIITAAHCVYDAELELEAYGITGSLEEWYKEQFSYTVTVERDMTIGATLINFSENMDFAILKLDQPIYTRKYLTLRNSKEVKQGEQVYSVGFPAYYDDQNYDSTYTVDDVTMKTGIVSKTQGMDDFYYSSGRHFNGDILTTTCEVSGGDSGGPLVDANGYVIGVSVFSASASANESFYGATAIDQIMRACDNLGIDYHTADASVPVETEAAEPETTAAPETEATEAPTEATEAATEATEETKAAEIVKEDGPDMTMILIVVAVAVVAVVVVVVVVMSKGKKKQPAQAPAGGYVPPVAPPVGGSTVQTNNGGFTQAPIFTPTDAGETSVLTQDAGATTVLTANGGALTRKGSGEVIKISKPEFVIGRNRAAVDYCPTGNTSISGKHAKLVIQGSETYIVDLKSTNGTFVNDAKLTPNQQTLLKSGDKITLADEDFTFNK